MEIDISRTVLGGVAASIAWFIIGGALYMNPFIARVYEEAKDSPALRKWDSLPKYLGLMFTGGSLAQILLWAFVFALIRPALPESTLSQGIVFGLVLVATKIFPRLFDMWIQTTYPNKLLAIEFINGTIGGFIVGVIFAYAI